MIAAGAGLVAVLAGVGAMFALKGGDADASGTAAGAPPQVTDTLASAQAPNPGDASPTGATPTGTTPTGTPIAAADSGTPPASAPATPPITTPPVTAPPRVPAPAPARPAGGTRASGDGVAARRSLDSLTTVLDPDRVDEATARAAIPVLRALLPRLATRDDSTYAHIRLLEANALSGNESGACTALRAAKGGARTSEQREIVRRYEGQLSC